MGTTVTDPGLLKRGNDVVALLLKVQGQQIKRKKMPDWLIPWHLRKRQIN